MSKILETDNTFTKNILVIGAPAAGILPASGITETTATLHGTVTNARGTVSSTDATFNTTPLPDSDTDGLLDAWELTHFGNLTHDGNDDPDGDGEDNAFEQLAGTVPSDANSLLTLAPAAPAGTFTISHVRPRIRYTLEASDNATAWTPLQSATFAAEGSGQIADPRETPPARSLYRLKVQPE